MRFHPLFSDGDCIRNHSMKGLSRVVLGSIAGAFLGAASFLALPPNQANAGMTCDTDWMGRQVCKTTGGTTYTGDKDWMGRDTWKGSDGTSTTCDTDSKGRYVCK